MGANSSEAGPDRVRACATLGSTKGTVIHRARPRRAGGLEDGLAVGIAEPARSLLPRGIADRL